MDENDDDLLNFTEIPVMSNDGVHDPSDPVPTNQNNELNEDEEEDLVLDRGNEYKMISIMRQKRKKIVSNPYDDETKLSKIEEEEAGQQRQEGKWTNALPKFGKEEDMEEVKRVPAE